MNSLDFHLQLRQVLSFYPSSFSANETNPFALHLHISKKNNVNVYAWKFFLEHEFSNEALNFITGRKAGKNLQKRIKTSNFGLFHKFKTFFLKKN